VILLGLELDKARSMIQSLSRAEEQPVKYSENKDEKAEKTALTDTNSRLKEALEQTRGEL
jgi:hypothetical protein